MSTTFLPQVPTPAERTPSAYQLEQSVSLWQQLHAAIVEDDPSFEADEDEIERLIRDAGLHPPRVMLERLIDASVTAGHKVDHFDNLRKRYTTRRDRYREREDKLRRTIAQLMDVLGAKAVEAELGAASFTKPRASVEVPDITKLAEEFIKRTDPEPRRLEIAAALRAGKPVEGAQWSDTAQAAPVLRITAY